MAVTASVKVLIPSAGSGIRFAAVRVPLTLPDVTPVGKVKKGNKIGPTTPGLPKWMEPAAGRPGGDLCGRCKLCEAK